METNKSQQLLAAAIRIIQAIDADKEHGLLDFEATNGQAVDEIRKAVLDYCEATPEAR